MFIVLAGYTEWSPPVSVAMITAAIGASAFCQICVRVIHLDIAPRYAGKGSLSDALMNNCSFMYMQIHTSTDTDWYK